MQANNCHMTNAVRGFGVKFQYQITGFPVQDPVLFTSVHYLVLLRFLILSSAINFWLQHIKKSTASLDSASLRHYYHADLY